MTFVQLCLQAAEEYIEFSAKCEKFYLSKKRSPGDQQMEDFNVKPCDFLYRLPPIQSGVVVYGACFSKDNQWKHPSIEIKYSPVSSSRSFIYITFRKQRKTWTAPAIFKCNFVCFSSFHLHTDGRHNVFIISNHEFNGFHICLASSSNPSSGSSPLMPHSCCLVLVSFRNDLPSTSVSLLHRVSCYSCFLL